MEEKWKAEPPCKVAIASLETKEEEEGNKMAPKTKEDGGEGKRPQKTFYLFSIVSLPQLI